SRRGSVAATRVAVDLRRDVDGGGDALHRVDEREVQGRFEVRAPLHPRRASGAPGSAPAGATATAAEDVAEEVSEVVDPETSAAGAAAGPGSTPEEIADRAHVADLV